MRWREWLGVGERRWKKAPDEEVQPGKTLWDWLQLLIVPAILVGVTFAWSASQTRSDNRRDDRRIAADRAAAEKARQDATLQGYLDQMSGLMLHEKLLTSKPDDAVRAVARTVTLTALRRLDGERKGEVLSFLGEAGLLGGRDFGASLACGSAGVARVDLDHADVRGADLQSALLYDTDLTAANLAGVKLIGVDLECTNFEDANLSGADLRGAYLLHTNLNNTRLSGADLRGANLRGAEGLDLFVFITDLGPKRRKAFLDSERRFLDSMSRDELARFNLSPERLAKFRREARGD